jgi:mandelate racemase
MSSPVLLTVRDLRVRAVNVPLRLALQTSGGTITVAPLALIDLQTEEGITGSSYLFCYTPLVLKPVVTLLVNLSELIRGDGATPLELERKLQGRFRLLGAKGLAGMAMSGIDMAAWDALAKAHGLSLARLLGGGVRPVPAYNSCGLGMIGPERAAAEAVELLAPGFRALKVRLGYPDVPTDLAVVRAVRDAIGDDVQLMADYNQTLSVAEATRRVGALDGEGLCWIEEPVRRRRLRGPRPDPGQGRDAHSDGRELVGAARDGAIRGCRCLGPGDAGCHEDRRRERLDARRGHCRDRRPPGLEPPVPGRERPSSGGVTHLSLARVRGLGGADPAGAGRGSEDGCVSAPDVPGTGISWDEAAVEQYLVQ